MLRGALGAAVGAVICATGLPLPGVDLSASAHGGQDDEAARRPQPGDLLVRTSDQAATPLRLDDIGAGAPTLAWAVDPATRTVRNGSRFNQVLLLKLDHATLSPETQARAASGVVAYSVICPHSGCDATDWMAAEQRLLCACHSSIFDPKDGARVVDGPAPRNLPALPLSVNDGQLAVAGGFSDKVGFEAA